MGTKRTLARAGYILAVATLWLIVLTAALEVSATVRIHWVETHNPLILAAKDLGPIPDFPAVKRPEKSLPPDLNKSVPPFQAKSHSTESPDCPYLRVPSPISADTRAQWRDAFWKTPEADRNSSAILHDEMVIAFNANSHILNLYGDGMMKQFFRLLWEKPSSRGIRATRREMAATIQGVI